VPITGQVTPDVLRDYLDGRLSVFEGQQVEQAIRDDQEIARAFEMIREGMEVIRARVEVEKEVPPEWVTIISRWDLKGRS
jgi:anti-sigma factor RsiW